jgi:PAS domain S-box-containing protein
LNQRWLDYTGLSAEQVLGSGWEVAIHPDDLNDLVDYWRRVVASGQPGEIEGRLRRSDGVYRWFLFRATASLDENGRVVKWYGTNTDIDDRKRAEQVLQFRTHASSCCSNSSGKHGSFIQITFCRPSRRS